MRLTQMYVAPRLEGCGIVLVLKQGCWRSSRHLNIFFLVSWSWHCYAVSAKPVIVLLPGTFGDWGKRVLGEPFEPKYREESLLNFFCRWCGCSERGAGKVPMASQIRICQTSKAVRQGTFCKPYIGGRKGIVRGGIKHWVSWFYGQTSTKSTC